MKPWDKLLQQLISNFGLLNVRLFQVGLLEQQDSYH